MRTVIYLLRFFWTYSHRLSWTSVLVKMGPNEIPFKQGKLITKFGVTPLLRCHLVDWIWACAFWCLVAMGKPKATLHQSTKKAMEVPRGIKGETPTKSKRDRERAWTLRALSKIGAPKVDSLVFQCAKQQWFATAIWCGYRCCLMMLQHTIDA